MTRATRVRPSSSTWSRAYGTPRSTARLVALANSGAISEENHIDLAAFGSLCAAHVVLDLQRAVGRNVRMAPGGRVIAMAADRHSDTHLALVHGGPFCGSI